MNLQWLKSKSATIAELQSQVGAAREAHQQSIEAVASAAAAFDEDPSKISDVLDAQQAERAAMAHVDRAGRMLSDAKAKAEAEARAKLERRANELREQLSHEQLRKLRAPTLASEIAALKAAVEARAKRHEVEEHIERLEHELKRLRVQLGEPAETVFNVSAMLLGPTRPSIDDVAAGLADAFKDLGTDDKRRRYANAMSSYLRNA